MGLSWQSVLVWRMVHFRPRPHFSAPCLVSTSGILLMYAVPRACPLSILLQALHAKM